MSITDDVSSQMLNKAETELPQALRSGTEAIKNLAQISKSALSTATTGTVTGIALVFKASSFSTKFIMQAVGRMKHNPKYYKNNISIAELEKNSEIRQVDSNLTKEEMKYFEKSCKKFGIQYNAVVDKSNLKEPTYYIFFRGKDTSVIEAAMKETYEAYVREQAKPRYSVKAKLAFFRDRVKARDQEQQDLGKEKHHNHSDRQR
ncbi:MAG: PcfB family protein [Suilimivivens sp.]